MNKVLLNDLKEISLSSSVNWEKIDGKSFLITGATGLIGSILVKSLQLRNKLKNSNIKIYIIVRNKEKAYNLFSLVNLEVIESSIENYIPKNLNIDYIIHAASPTRSKFLNNNPVETINIQIMGTKNILEQAKLSNITSMVYISSMEVYGTLNCKNVEENKLGYIDIYNTRSSYSEGKRLCELLNYSYFKEYSIPTKSARLAQTFGPGISNNENRVFKYFSDCIINKQDIILKSNGKTLINYCYTTDVIIALLMILINGNNGETYNVAGNKTKMNIYDSAKWLIEEYKTNKKVIIDIDNHNDFAPENQMLLSNHKLKSIGWQPKHNIKYGYKNLIKFLIEENNKKDC